MTAKFSTTRNVASCFTFAFNAHVKGGISPWSEFGRSAVRFMWMTEGKITDHIAAVENAGLKSD